MLTTFNEPHEKQSPYIRWATPLDVFRSKSADEAETVEKPQLSFLRLELTRLRTGMSDFIIRVSTPQVPNLPRSNTVVSFRGGRNLSKATGPSSLAKLIKAEMEKRGDKTHAWAKTDVDHLARLVGLVKIFAGQPQMDTMAFTTEALL